LAGLDIPVARTTDCDTIALQQFCVFHANHCYMENGYTPLLQYQSRHSLQPSVGWKKRVSALWLSNNTNSDGCLAYSSHTKVKSAAWPISCWSPGADKL